ncbi:hypothetical protein [Burkholderia contaminans]|uniref:hypothetical protein n=1 Tax=Burkholderia contaminans TaxID=488447 RepID=UPI000D00668B|nr:hypothetical protein [Burkholderia contaminans]PRD92273.1 hypothetical protein C6P88_16580 [Burkholderia contaminans]
MSEATVNLIPSTESIRLERVALEATYQREASEGVPHFERLAAVTDPVITPFVRALKAEGFSIKALRSGCDVLGTCPTCRGRYLYTAIKDGVEYCPHCREAADRKRS